MPDLHLLKELCKAWQKRLRLQDWDISVAWAKPAQLGDTDQLGRCLVYANNKEARIAIVDPDALPDPFPIEYVLVHEMCHILLDPLCTREELNMLHIEQALHGFVHGLLGGPNEATKHYLPIHGNGIDTSASAEAAHPDTAGSASGQGNSSDSKHRPRKGSGDRISSSSSSVRRSKRRKTSR